MTVTPLSIAFSPCPNDTFAFYAWTHGLIPGAPPVDITFADVDVTNGAAERGEFDVVKVSYAALPWLLDQYALLPSGGALGRGCGPLVLTAGRTDLRGASIVVPGERTTAYLLFRLWAADQGVGEISVLPFPEIMPAVRDGKIRRRLGDPRGALHLRQLRPDQRGRSRRMVGVRHRLAHPARCHPRQTTVWTSMGWPPLHGPPWSTHSPTPRRPPSLWRSMRVRWIPRCRRATLPYTSTNSRSTSATRATQRSPGC